MYMYWAPEDEQHRKVILARKEALEFIGTQPWPINTIVKELAKPWRTLEDTNERWWIFDKNCLITD